MGDNNNPFGDNNNRDQGQNYNFPSGMSGLPNYTNSDFYKSESRRGAIIDLIVGLIPMVLVIAFFVGLFFFLKYVMGVAGETPFIEKAAFAVIIIIAVKVMGSKKK